MTTKREPRIPRVDGPLLDPESFWNGEEPTAEEAAGSDAVVVSQPPSRTVAGGATARPATAAAPRPAQPAAARPVPPTAPPSRFEAPPRPRKPAPAPAAPRPFSPPKEARVRPDTPPASSDEDPAQGDSARRLSIRGLLLLLLVAAVSALLGWYLVGRFAAEETAPDQPRAGAGADAKAAEALAAPAREALAAEASKTPELAPGPPSAPRVTLTVLSDPPSAEVLVDGQFRGLTPVTVHGLLRQGEITLRIQTAGYQPWEQRIALAEAQPELQITAGLRKDDACPKGQGWIYVTTEPAGASVDLDGKRRPGQTPMIIDKVCAGVHEVVVQAKGRQAYRGKFEVGAGSVKNLNLELKP